jgi:hypothetical protein
MTHADEFGPYSYHSWPVRLDPDQHEGRSVWEHCPKELWGKNVLLTVQNLPQMLCTIGPNKSRVVAANGSPVGVGDRGLFGWVNQSVLRLGGFPSTKTPLTVGCELYVIPSWQIQLVQTLAALAPPLRGSLDGVDVRPLQGHEVDRVQIWAKVPDGDPALIAPRIWLRHPSGVWAESQPNVLGAAPAVVSSWVYDVPVRDADRVYLSFGYSGPPAASPVEIAYGLLTAPERDASRGEKFVIRFGAVVAPYT